MNSELRLRADEARAPENLKTLKILSPPVRSGRFWIVQGEVLLVVLVDTVVLDGHNVQLPFRMPSSVVVVLLSVPIIYAALNFGVRGAAATALWASALMVPDWVFRDGGVTPHVWLEVSYLAFGVAVAIVVGQRVEREEEARGRAEEALRASKVAEARYRGLFDEHAFPVLVTDAAGVVTQANTATVQLLGPDVPGHLLADLVGASPVAILAEPATRLTVRAPDGDQHLFVPRARALEVGSGESLVQVVLIDVTEEQRHADEQRAYAGHLLAVQEDERRSLARDLHDDPLQTLTYLVRALDQTAQDPLLPPPLAARIKRDGELAAEVGSSLRKVIHGLRPPVLDDLGLVAALRHLVAEVRGRCGLPVTLRVRGEETRLASPTELAVYRVTQEALNNIVRHSQAKRVQVDLRFGDSVQLTVTDDGVGMPQTSGPGEKPGGLGLVGMRERVQFLNGSLETNARKPHGTVVRARLPLTMPEPAGAPSPPTAATNLEPQPPRTTDC